MARRHHAAPLAAVAAAVAAGALATGTTPAHAAGDYLGKSTNRHGTVTVEFSTDPGWVVLRLDAKMRKGSRGKLLDLQCRDGRRYRSVLGVRWAGNPSFGGPAALPEGSDRCRIRRAGTVVATMRMRLRKPKD